jgi:predicted enzyme related to lactoylglutathione lyase
MPIKATYTHTNLIARDWRRLADFYINVFGCVPVPPERDLKGEAVDKGTGIPGAHITGMHLRLPGHGDSGPTIEVFSYNLLTEDGLKRVNRPGWSHIAFRVEDVPTAVKEVEALGGTLIGEMVTTRVGEDKSITWCYMADPEGNIVELQTAIR